MAETKFNQMSVLLIKRISVEIIKQINRRVGFRIVTKFGEKGVVNIGKYIPILGGVISETVDGWEHVLLVK